MASLSAGGPASPASVTGSRCRARRRLKKLRVDETVEQPEITVPKLAGGTWYLRAQAIDTDGATGEFAPAQKVKLPCRLCRVGAGAGAVLLLLSL